MVIIISFDRLEDRPTQGMVDGSASKPALRQDTGYMVEKTYLDISSFRIRDQYDGHLEIIM